MFSVRWVWWVGNGNAYGGYGQYGHYGPYGTKLGKPNTNRLSFGFFHK